MWNFESDCVTSDITLYAYFVAVEYTITYVLDGGTNNAGNHDKYTVENPVTLLDPSKSHFSFIGWFDENGVNVSSLDISSCTIQNEHSHDVTIYARWERIKTIPIPTIKNPDSYIYNGKEQTCELTISEDDLDYVTITGNKATNAGKYTITITLKDSTFTWEKDGIDTKDSSPIVIDNWIIKQKTITFKYNTINITNGTVPSANSTIEYGDDIIIDASSTSIEGVCTNETISYYLVYSIKDSNNKIYPNEVQGFNYTFTNPSISVGNCTLTIVPKLYTSEDTSNYNSFNSNYVINSSTTKDFTINNLRLYLKNTDILEKDITETRIWTAIQTFLIDNVKFYRYLNNEEYTKTINGKSCIGMQDGQFKYGSPSINNDLKNVIKTKVSEDGNSSIWEISTNANSYVVGSTYYAYYSVGNNFEIVNKDTGLNQNINDYIIFKYKSVYAESGYMTIEDALSSNASSIYMWGNADNYGLTTFTSIRSIYNDTTIYNVSNMKVYVPYRLDSYDTYKESAYNDSDKVFSCLIVPSEITLNLKEKSILAVCASLDMYSSQGGSSVTRLRGLIYNNGIINMYNSTLYSYGYIKGGGRINLNDNSAAYDVLKVFNWSGGSAAYSMAEIQSWSVTKYNLTVLPFTEYSFHNISCETKISSTATYSGYFLTQVSGTMQDVTIELLGNSSSSSCIFKPLASSDENYIIKKAARSKSDIKNNTGTSLYMLNNSNQVAGQRDIIEIHGKYTDSSLNFSIDISISIFTGTVTLNTSTSVTLPISYMHVTLKENSNLTLKSSDYILMPGTSFTVEKNSTLNVEQNVDVTISDYENFKAYMGLCIDTNGAIFTVNGTVNNNGNIGGFIDTNSADALLNFTGSTVSNYKLYYTPSDPYVKSGNVTSTGKFKLSSNKYSTGSLVTGSYVSQEVSGIYAWSQTKARIEYVLNNGETNKFGKDYDVSKGPVKINSAEISDPTRNHYTFGGWYTDATFTTLAFETPYELYISSKVYAKWIPDEYAISYNYKYNNCESEDTIENPNNPSNYVYGTTIDLDTNDVKNGNLVFGGWFIDENCTTPIYQLDTSITSDTTIYGLWYPSGTVTITINYVFSFDNEDIRNNFENYNIELTKKSENIVSLNTQWTPTPYGTTYNEKTSIPYWIDSWFSDEACTNKFTNTDFITKINEFTSDSYEGKYVITLYAIIKNKVSLEIYKSTINKTTDSSSEISIDLLYYVPGTKVEIDTIVNQYEELEEIIGRKRYFTAINGTITNNELIISTTEQNTKLYINDILPLTLTIKNNTGYLTRYTISFNEGYVINKNNPSTTELANSETLSLQVEYGSKLIIKVEAYYAISVFSSKIWHDRGNLTDSNNNEFNGEYSLTVDTEIEVTEDSGCFIEGTLITLCDGSQKKVEDLTANDLLLVFNHETGTYDKAYAAYVIHENEEKQLQRIINLKFSDGTTIGIVSEHGFFNIEQNEYVFINENNINEYIGKHFYTINNTTNKVELVDYEIEEKVVRVYSPISEYHLNCFAEGILSVSNFLDGLVNIFTLDDSMKYDEKSMIEDINKYGLADINDFSNFADVETIKKFPYQYLSIAIGKGKITLEELEWLYNTFVKTYD